MINPAQWDELVVPKSKHDHAVLRVSSAALPGDWMNRSPAALINGGAMIAARYERLAIAESIRNHVIFHSKPAEIVVLMDRNPDLSRLVALHDQFFLDIANDIEAGTLVK